MRPLVAGVGCALVIVAGFIVAGRRATLHAAAPPGSPSALPAGDESYSWQKECGFGCARRIRELLDIDAGADSVLVLYGEYRIDWVSGTGFGLQRIDAAPDGYTAVLFIRSDEGSSTLRVNTGTRLTIESEKAVHHFVAIEVNEAGVLLERRPSTPRQADSGQ